MYRAHGGFESDDVSYLGRVESNAGLCSTPDPSSTWFPVNTMIVNNDVGRPARSTNEHDVACRIWKVEML